MSDFKLPVCVSFNMPVAPAGISAFLVKVLEEIGRYITIPDKLKSRIKLILTELCTNFIKHVKTNDGKIDLEIGEESMLITKRYKENAFKEIIERKINIDKVGEIVEIFFSETNNHYVKICEGNKLLFLNPIELGLYTDVLKDHFGLHILTLASNNFLYEYNHKTKEDCFTLHVEYV